MPYVETHEIVIGPITLPAGVTAEVSTVAGTGGQQAVTVRGVTGTTKADTVTLLRSAFALLMTAATAEGVGAPVFGRDATAPTAPGGLAVAARSSTQVDLSWVAATDNAAVVEYVITRDGAKIATVAGATTTFSDTTTVAATSYTYEVVAADAAGNLSAPSNAVTVTTP